jgi:hypothetical protein
VHRELMARVSRGPFYSGKERRLIARVKTAFSKKTAKNSDAILVI